MGETFHIKMSIKLKPGMDKEFIDKTIKYCNTIDADEAKSVTAEDIAAYPKYHGLGSRSLGWHLDFVKDKTSPAEYAAAIVTFTEGDAKVSTDGEFFTVSADYNMFSGWAACVKDWIDYVKETLDEGTEFHISFNPFMWYDISIKTNNGYYILSETCSEALSPSDFEYYHERLSAEAEAKPGLDASDESDALDEFEF